MSISIEHEANISEAIAAFDDLVEIINVGDYDPEMERIITAMNRMSDALEVIKEE
jgi:hypothetical protein